MNNKSKNDTKIELKGPCYQINATISKNVLKNTLLQS